jgi:hypothetical protein
LPILDAGKEKEYLKRKMKELVMFNTGIFADNHRQSSFSQAQSDLDYIHSFNLYNHMLWQGTRGRLISLFTKRNQLEALHTLLASRAVRASYDAGLQTVPLDLIVGSEGRVQDFDRRFNPRNDRTSQRWMRIAQAYLSGKSLPPVMLVEVEGRYYVRDGHHRISVARALGQTDIDAQVQVYELEPVKPAHSWKPVMGAACLAG